ncbi:MAG TPA: hypothetical protein VHU14_01640 [Solirubrobacterales bacterium]|nr:hypothetical protein [Solirubrobacterales bacterium]
MASHLRVFVCCVAVGIFFLVFTPLSFAGPPSHQENEALDIAGLNHACGTAVDTEGDVYVSSAGESKIKVFTPSHSELTSITDVNEPCGLAVNAKGELFVSRKASGKVVRYKPNAYPLTGSPSYGLAEAIDSSGNAKGVSIDTHDGRLYVAEGNRISVYDSKGNLDVANEVQKFVISEEATGGTYTLSFKGQKTTPIAWNASATTVREALEGLSTIGAGNVSIVPEGIAFIVTFEGALAASNLALLQGDGSGLTGGGGLSIKGVADGFDGHIGEGELIDATGVAPYFYANSSEGDRYLVVADAATNKVVLFNGPDVKSLKVRREIPGPRVGEDFGFGVAGAYVAVDSGNRNAEDKCVSVGEQACTAGHFFVYDSTHGVVDEFDAHGEFVDQIVDPSFADAKPSAIAVDRSGGVNDGTVYVTSGDAAGAKLLAFRPLAAPSRALRPELSRVLKTTAAMSTDSHGDVYALAGSLIHAFGPTGTEIKVGSAGKGIEDPNHAHDIAVDSAGNVYVADTGNGFDGEFKVTYYTPSAYPPVDGTTYTRHEPALDLLDNVKSIAVDPKNNHLFVTAPASTHELDSAAAGSAILKSCFACGLPLGFRSSLAVDGASGDVYVANRGNGSSLISVVDAEGTEVLARVNGGGSPKGQFGESPDIAVDQSNAHVLEYDEEGNAREYDAAGGFVAEFGQLNEGTNDVAVDNACAIHRNGLGKPEPLSEITSPTCKEYDPANGTIYIGTEAPVTAGHPFNVTAFGPLEYGEPPGAVTGIADGIGVGATTLHGTVDPRGFELEDCRFEYLSDAEYKHNIAEEKPAFTGSTPKACAESPEEVGHGTGPVAVQASITGGLDPETTRYRYRLVAKNKYGEGKGGAGLFGPPVLSLKAALPVLYEEATLRGEVDPSGLATSYHFEYLTDAEYLSNGETFTGAESTPVAELAPADGPIALHVVLTGLSESTEYRFRLIAENEAMKVEGATQAFETLERTASPPCANGEFRTGLSTNLPDCRAYELVTPAQTNGLSPGANILFTGVNGAGFNNWLATPRGPAAGERVSYFTEGTLPGFDGNGFLDGYRAQRSPGAHPAEGWTSELFAPTFPQAVPDFFHSISQQSVGSDQLYSFWQVNPAESLAGTLEAGIYLRSPAGFEAVGRGTNPPHTDLKAVGNYVSPGGAHVIFTSKAHLEEDAAPAGIEALYDRPVDSETAQVLSLKPDGAAFNQDATFVGATEAGTAVVFEVGGALYLRREGQTTEIATSPSTFAGISEDGKRVFFAATTYSPTAPAPGGLFACDSEEGPCAGAGAQAPVQIAPSSIFVSVSPDGSKVLFTSEAALTLAGEENENGEHAEAAESNLYLWDDNTETAHFVARLDSRDFESKSFAGTSSMTLDAWTTAISSSQLIGRAESPTRATPDGGVFVFQSHAKLTGYDNTGPCGDEGATALCGEIYRYEPTAAVGQRLLCVSCDPSGAPPDSDALLQDYKSGTGVRQQTRIANLTDNGQRVFFESANRLLPEDANSAEDVYEWKAQGAGTPACNRPGGCLALISSGQGESNNHIYGMSADGRDVFFRTPEKLVGSDVAGSVSIYDAREFGGIPESPAPAPCQGDSCQGNGSEPPALSPAATTGAGNGNAEEPKAHCPTGRHRVKGRCVKPRKKHHRQHRVNHKRRSGK